MRSGQHHSSIPRTPRAARRRTAWPALTDHDADGHSMTITTTSALIDLLQRHQLLEESQLEKLPAAARGFSTPAALAQELLRRNWLTPFQVNQLFRGRAAELVVEHYHILGRLAEGGAGQVFKARHRLMRRVVALKVIRPDLLADAEVVQRFLREIRVASQLMHPHVVHAYDAGPTGATYFLAMEYVEGPDLATLVRTGGPLPVAQACEYIRQAALALHHAHERGLVHRDVKPPNLLVTSPAAPPPGAPAAPGIIKLLDLGLARLQRPLAGDGTNLLTPAGPVMLGTIDYMAPEQAVDFHGADHRADIYALGCTTYFLLTGQPPFPGGSLAQKLLRHQQAPPRPLTQLHSDVSPALAAIVARMLGKRPEDRFATAGDVAQALALLKPAGAARSRPPVAVLAPMPAAGAPRAIPLPPAGGRAWIDPLRRRAARCFEAARKLIHPSRLS